MIFTKAKRKDTWNFNMHKSLLISLLCLIFHFVSFSQEYDPYTYQDIDKSNNFKDKLYFGGSIGLRFGNITVINLYPEAGYKIKENFDIGAGVHYTYVKYNNLFGISDHIYGGKIFSRFFVSKGLFLTAEANTYNISDYDIYTGQKTGSRIFIPGFLAGAGLYQKLGDRFAVVTTLMYNFLQNEKTPYSNPVLNIGFVY